MMRFSVGTEVKRDASLSGQQVRDCSIEELEKGQGMVMFVDHAVRLHLSWPCRCPLALFSDLGSVNVEKDWHWQESNTKKAQ